MAHSALTFAKTVSTPTQIAWSQAYNAGSFFAVLSLEKYGDSEIEESLGQIGRQFLETLEQEFFALEEKTNKNIKQVIAICAQKAPENIKISFAAAFIPPQNTNILYLFLYGNGSIAIKREENFGMLLQKIEPDKEISTASGYLEKDDVIVLETHQFGTILSTQELQKLISDSAEETAEIITPIVHGKDNGGAAALFLSYHPPTAIPEKIEEETLDSIVQMVNKPNPDRKYNRISRKIHLPNISLPKLRKKQLIILLIAVLLIGVFLFGIFHSLQKQQNNRESALFEQLYPTAERKYKEGMALASLNSILAQNAFVDAQKMIAENINKFPPGSSERVQFLALNQKVATAMTSTSGESTVTLTQSNSSSSNQLLSTLQNNPQYLDITQDENSIFALSETGVTSIDKSTGKRKIIIQNKNDWGNPTGIATYLGNVYILDNSKNQLLKYTTTDNGFVKTNYFIPTSSPDLSKSTAIAIDGSVYILFPDSIQKFSRGNPEAFTLSGINKPLTSASKIYTSTTDSYIYVLDAQNSRIVSFDKNGQYQKSYNAKTLKNAKDFTIDETQKRCYILIDNKIWQFDF